MPSDGTRRKNGWRVTRVCCMRFRWTGISRRVCCGVSTRDAHRRVSFWLPRHFLPPCLVTAHFHSRSDSVRSRPTRSPASSTSPRRPASADSRSPHQHRAAADSQVGAGPRPCRQTTRAAQRRPSARIRSKATRQRWAPARYRLLTAVGVRTRFDGAARRKRETDRARS